MWVIKSPSRSPVMSPLIERIQFTFTKAVSLSCLVPFSRYGKLVVKIRKFFRPHVYLAPTLGVTILKYYSGVWQQKHGVHAALFA